MAERRMFTKKITDDDNFTSLSASAQALYFHLNTCADDDGFNNQVSLAMFKAHASVDDLKVLLAKNYLIRFESGVIVIKHWRMHNTLRKDRYTPTAFQKELKQLGVKDNGSYTVGLPSGCQTVADGVPQIRIDQDRIEQERGEEKAGLGALKKHQYGEHKNVLLTDEEYAKLKERFPNDCTQKIETLSEAIARKGYKYKSHYLAILDWARRDEKKAAQPAVSANPFLDLLKGEGST